MPEYFEMEDNGKTIAVMHRKKKKFQRILFFGIIASLFLILLVLVGNSYFQNKDLKKNRIISLETVMNQTKNNDGGLNVGSGCFSSASFPKSKICDMLIAAKNY